MENERDTLCDEMARKSLGARGKGKSSAGQPSGSQLVGDDILTLYEFLMDVARKTDPFLLIPLVYGDFVLEAARGYGHEEMRETTIDDDCFIFLFSWS
ncbi:uncharacterized protein A4U43_C09F13170 [Asparagus officinalis]|uniref:Uncharacterized protein n=1 Tax=Asparagus officinalis TaxID=4686 RepID=A0A5P1EAA6_ASPOF|nr:uncharacterized protein A4U43_C09F13170 [Asparagus officinalis]